MCRSRRELSNEYLLANFGFDTAENEPYKVCPIRLGPLRAPAAAAAAWELGSISRATTIASTTRCRVAAGRALSSSVTAIAYAIYGCPDNAQYATPTTTIATVTCARTTVV